MEMFEAILSSRIVQAVGMALFHSLWQGAVLALAAAMVLVMMRKRSAAKRYVAAYAALALMAIVPGATFCWVLPNVRSGALEGSAPEGQVVEAVSLNSEAGQTERVHSGIALSGEPYRHSLPRETGPIGAGSAEFVEPIRPSQVKQVLAALQIIAPWVALVWAMGVAVLSLRLAGGLMHIRRLKRRGVAAPAQCVAVMVQLCERMGIARVVTLLESTLVKTPCIVGWLKPVILLPASAVLHLSPEQLEAVLLHELAHIRRHDWLFALLQQILETLLFYHPATWWLSRRIRAERELCCDDLVVGITRDRVTYARALTALAFAAQGSALAPAATGGPLFARIQRILGLEPIHPRRKTTGAVSAVLTATVAALILVAGYVEAALDPHRLEFPEDNSVGTIEVRPETDTYDWTLTQDKANSNWEKFAEAKGLVVIPDGKVARLKVTDDEKLEDLAFLDALHPDSLSFLDVARIEVKYSALDRVARLTGLKALNLERTGVSDEGIQKLAPLKQLEWLNLKASNATGNGGELAPFIRLKQLLLASHLVEDSALAPVEQMTGLQSLSLDWSKVTGKGLQHLQALHQLKSLSLDSVPIRDADFAVMGSIQSLQSLNLNNTQITDASMAVIKKMPNIKTRIVNGTLISGAKDQKQFYHGRVVDEEGRPIADVTAEIRYSEVGSPGVSGGETTTDADGRWTYAVPLEYANLYVSFKHPDFISDWVMGVRKIPSKESMLDGTAKWVMKKGREVSGHVAGPDGKPCASAWVLTKIYFGGDMEEARKRDPEIVQTDTKGDFHLRHLADDVKFLTILPDGYAPKIVAVDYAKLNGPLEISVEPGVDISGHVVDTNGQPLKDVRIQIDEWRVSLQHTINREVVTDDSGNFTLSNMPSEGTLRLSIHKKDYFGASATLQLPVEGASTYEMVKRSDFVGKVVDAETGKTVGPFTAVLGAKGWHDREEQQVHWFTNFTDSKIDASKGTFTATPYIGLIADAPGTPRQKLVARIQASGYYLGISEPQDIADIGKEVVIQMRKGSPIRAIARDAQGNPVPNARVLWVESHEKAFVQNGTPNEDYVGASSLITETGKDGAFEFPARDEAGTVLVLHDSGYVWAVSTDLKPDTALTLTPWCRVEGKIHDANGKPIPIMLTVEQPTLLEKSGLIQWMFQVTSGDDGVFSIDKVPALPLTIGKAVRWTTSHGLQVSPKPGETVHVAIATGGRRIVGQLDFERVKSLFDGTTLEMTDDRHLFLSFKPKTGAEKPAFEPLYIPDVKEDGSFEVVGVPPGEYEFTVDFHASPPPSACGRGTTIGEFEKLVAVEKGDETTPIDVGVSSLAAVEFPKAGTTAPEITGGDLASGNDWKLSEERGKYVLLDFWATWCGPCQAAVPKIRQVFEKAGDKLAVIGLNLDFEQDDAKKHIAANNMKWKQAHIGEWSDTNRVTSTYGVSYIPSLWLLDPQGNVVARDIPIDKLEETLAAAIK